MNKIDSKLFSFETLFPMGQFQVPVGQIYQIGELSVVRGGEIPEHIQYCDEITYVIAGKAKVYSKDECFELTGGQIHYLKKGLYHKIIADMDENFRYICIGYLPDEKNCDIQDFLLATKDIEHLVVSDDGDIRVLSEMLINEMYIKDSQSDKMINYYITQILISLYRLIREKGERALVEKTNSGFTIYHMLRYIDREYLNIKSVKAISEKLSYNEYYLSHLFKEKIGMSIKEYIMEKKLKYAAVLLKSSDLSVEEITEHLNFASSHTFRQAFKRYFGVSPSGYKKSNSKF